MCQLKTVKFKKRTDRILFYVVQKLLHQEASNGLKTPYTVSRASLHLIIILKQYIEVVEMVEFGSFSPIGLAGKSSVVVLL